MIWDVKTKKIPKKPSLAMRFVKYAACAPRKATYIKKIKPVREDIDDWHYTAPRNLTKPVAKQMSRMYWVQPWTTNALELLPPDDYISDVVRALPQRKPWPEDEDWSDSSSTTTTTTDSSSGSKKGRVRPPDLPRPPPPWWTMPGSGVPSVYPGYRGYYGYPGYAGRGPGRGPGQVPPLFRAPPPGPRLPPRRWYRPPSRTHSLS